MPFNDSIYTMTPGSAVADTIQGILQRRREESRQAMIDKLNEENVRSQMHDRQVSQDLAAQQEGRLRDHSNREYNLQRIGMIPGGAERESLDPTLASEAAAMAMFKKVPGQRETIEPSQEVEYDPNTSPESATFKSGVEQPFTQNIPEKEVFAGNADYQKDALKRELINKFASDPNLSSMTPLQRVLRGAEADVSLPAPALVDKRRVVPVPWNQKTPIDLGPGDEAMEMNPAPGSHLPTFSYIGVDANGNPLAMSNRGTGPGGGPIIHTVPVPGGGPIGGKPTAGSNDLIPSTLLNQIAVARRAGGTRGAQSVQQTINSAIAAARTSETVKANVVAIMNDMQRFDQAGKPRPSLDAIMRQLEGMPEGEASDVYSILLAVEGAR